MTVPTEPKLVNSNYGNGSTPPGSSRTAEAPSTSRGSAAPVGSPRAL
jgi:hypothetical protein